VKVGKRAPGAVAVWAVVAAAGGCGSDRSGELASEELLGLVADQVMIDLEHYMTREGVRRALLVADTAFTYQDEERLRLRNLEVTFFGDAGEAEGVLTARTGVYELESGDFTVEGDVAVVDESQGKRLVTERLRYLAIADSLYGDTSFAFYRGNAEMRGTSFVSDPGMENIQAEAPSMVVPDVQPIQ
jgi:LPS export ABC transporter protein LptC